jgi:hypothetical protein
MAHIEGEILVKRPAEEVFDFVADERHEPRFNPHMLTAEKVSDGPIGLQIWYSLPTDKYFVLLPDGIASVYIVDVDGQRQVFLTQHRSATSDEDSRELQAILDSIHIET